METEVGTEVGTDMVMEVEIAQTKLKRVLAKLGDRIMTRIIEDPVGYNKALDILEKTVDSLPTTVDSALQKCLCTFGKTVTQVRTNKHTYRQSYIYNFALSFRHVQLAEERILV